MQREREQHRERDGEIYIEIDQETKIDIPFNLVFYLSLQSENIAFSVYRYNI